MFSCVYSTQGDLLCVGCASQLPAAGVPPPTEQPVYTAGTSIPQPSRRDVVRPTRI